MKAVLRRQGRIPSVDLWTLPTFAAGLLPFILVGACRNDRPSGAPTAAHLDAEPALLELDTMWEILNDRLHGVRAVHFAEGRRDQAAFVVLNGQAREVLVLDTAGNLKAALGRLGSGPGEFQSVTDAVVVGDSILVLDGVLKRIELFVRDTLAREWFLRPIPGMPTRLVLLNGDTLGLVVERRRALLNDRHGDPVFYRDSVLFLTVMDSGRTVSSRFWFLGDEGMALPAGPGRTFYATPSFGESVAYGLSSAGVIALEQRSGWLRRWTWNGHPRTLMAASTDTVFVSDAELALRADRVETVARELSGEEREYYLIGARTAVDRWNGRIPRPRFQGLVTDGSTVAIREFTYERRGPEAWQLLDSGGQLLGRLVMPQNAKLLAIRGDRIAAVTRDSLDVESILLLRLNAR